MCFKVQQFILEEASAEGRSLRIICTQPRRLPAIAVADRVAKERNERLGATVGYHIRLEQKTSSQTALTYCTSGVLLRMLTIDDVAHSISHIFLASYLCKGDSFIWSVQLHGCLNGQFASLCPIWAYPYDLHFFYAPNYCCHLTVMYAKLEVLHWLYGFCGQSSEKESQGKKCRLAIL